HLGLAVDGARAVLDERLGVGGDRVERVPRAIPLEHRELALVVRAVLAGAEAAARLIDALDPAGEQALHLVLGRRDEPAALAGAQVHREPGRAHPQRRLDLDELARREQLAQRRHHAAARRQVAAPRLPEARDLGAARRILGARILADAAQRRAGAVDLDEVPG